VTPRITMAKVLDVKPMESEVMFQPKGADPLASGTHTPVLETVLLDPRSAMEPEAEAAAPDTPVERSEPERSSIRSMLEDIVEQKVGLALEAWRGALQAHVEERAGRLAEALEAEREARLREQGELGAALQRTSDKLARLEEAHVKEAEATARALKDQRERFAHDVAQATHRLAAMEVYRNEQVNDISSLHEKLVNLQGTLGEHAHLLEKRGSVGGNCGVQQEDNFRYNPAKQIVGAGEPVPWCDFTELRLEFNALQSKVDELAAGEVGVRACQVGFDLQRNNAWQDLEARSPSPGGRSAKLEAARASRHGGAALGRKSQGAPSAGAPGGPGDTELARRLSAVGFQAQGQGTGLTLPGTVSKQSPISKLKRSASELPGQRLPLSPRSGCATARGTPAPESRPAARCGPPRPTPVAEPPREPPARRVGQQRR